MEEKRVQELFSLCSYQYGRGGMAGFEKFVQNYEGSHEEHDYLSNVLEVLKIRNSSGRSRVFCFGGKTSLGEIVEEGIIFSDNGVNERLRKYLD